MNALEDFVRKPSRFPRENDTQSGQEHRARGTATAAGASVWHRFLAWLPLVALFLVTLVLRDVRWRVGYESPVLVIACNFIFSTLASVFIAYLAGRSFLIRGSAGVLLLGCGAVAWGAAGVVANLASREDANLDVTIHNCGVWISALLQLAGAVLLSRPGVKVRNPEPWLAAAYLGALGAVGLVAFWAVQGDAPVFFVPGEGGTPIRQVVLGSGLAMFVLAAGVIALTSRGTNSRFAAWYVKALLMIAIGLMGIMVQLTIGGLAPWAGRAGLWLGGVYLVLAALASAREASAWGMGLEEALQEKEAEMALVLRSTPFMLTRCSRDLRYLFVSRAYAEMVGMTAEEIAGKPIVSIMGEKGFEAIRPHVQNVLQGQTVEYESDVEFARVGVRQLQVVYVPEVGAEGGVIGWVASMLDVTERNRAQQALAASEERTKQAVRVAGLGTFEHDHLLDVVVFSPLMREMTGFEEREEVTLAAIVQRVAVEDRQVFEGAVQRAHDPVGEGVFEVEYRIKNRRGELRWICARAQTFFEDKGGGRHAVRTIGAALDITERKAAQTELQSMVEDRTAKLQELVGELEHFSYTITHDLKSPLRAMRGFAEVASTMCEEGERERAKELLGRISSAAGRMDRLIADALSYSRSVRQELPLEDVDTGALLRGMLDSYPELQPQRAHIQVQGPLPVVLANEAGLTQCFSNLLGNAVKFAKAGELPDIRIWATQREGWVRLWVQDNGIGISKAMVPRVFDMFSRGSASYEGTGIGLALVRKAAQRMGGKVGVESEEDMGSRFWIELKSGEEREKLEQPLASVSAAVTGSGTVLYVEDQESDALFMRRAFERKGLGDTLQLVDNGRAAIEYLSGAGQFGDRDKYPLPAVVLLDLNLPQVPGFEVLEWMRNHPSYARTPVVVFSSSTREDDRARARRLGATDYWEKPSSVLKYGDLVEGLRGKWMKQ